MSRTALILACHGSRKEPTVNERFREHAAELQRIGLFDEVIVAFKQGTPSFAAVLDQTDADRVAVLPFMTSEGYTSRVFLPRELAKNVRFAETQVEYLRPLGTHAAIASLVFNRIQELIADFGLDESRTEVVIVGHGTDRQANSSDATERLARQLEECGLSIRTAYLDQKPTIDSVVDRSRRPHIIAIPFLIGTGPHATRDIPQRLGLLGSNDGAAPWRGAVGSHDVVCDSPVGSYSGMSGILRRAASAARHRLDRGAIANEASAA